VAKPTGKCTLTATTVPWDWITKALAMGTAGSAAKFVLLSFVFLHLHPCLLVGIHFSTGLIL
jgi:hypothetical protein